MVVIKYEIFVCLFWFWRKFFLNVLFFFMFCKFVFIDEMIKVLVLLFEVNNWDKGRDELGLMFLFNWFILLLRGMFGFFILFIFVLVLFIFRLLKVVFWEILIFVRFLVCNVLFELYVYWFILLLFCFFLILLLFVDILYFVVFFVIMICWWFLFFILVMFIGFGVMLLFWGIVL